MTHPGFKDVFGRVLRTRGLVAYAMVIAACGCGRLAGGQSWHEKHGWKAVDFFADPQVVALCEAIQANDLERMRSLIAAGADVNARGKGNMTPLLWAFPDDKLERFRLLLEAGADPNVYTDSDFGTPHAFRPGDSVTHMVSRSTFGHFWPVFEHGGDPDLPCKVPGFVGMTPVYLVIQSGAGDKRERISRLAKLGGSMNQAAGVGSSPLVTAEGWFGRYDLCLHLLDLGADPHAYEGDGVTKLAHFLAGRLEQQQRGLGQLRDASPEKMAAFNQLVERLESVGESLAAAQADRARWAAVSDLKELRAMQRKEREERERREREAAIDTPADGEAAEAAATP